MLPGGRSIIAIGYKHNMRKVLSFIVTENSGITQEDIHYLSKYPDQFYNVVIITVARSLIMYKLFVSVDEVESNNKSRQYDLVM